MGQLPLYIKIHDDIRKWIDKGRWKVGERLPSERELSEIFGVSRMTLRQAVTQLVDEGILERRVGSGTYVASERVREKMRGTTSFSEIIKAQGKKPTSRVLSYVKVTANDTERERLHLPEGAQIVRMERIRYADDLPIAFEVAAIPYETIKDFKKRDITSHFFDTLKAAGMDIGRSEQVISARVASKDIAKALNLKSGAAILSLTQTSYFADDTPFEYVLSSYAGDRFEYFLER
jgi:GntR family transcriptional regulator